MRWMLVVAVALAGCTQAPSDGTASSTDGRQSCPALPCVAPAAFAWHNESMEGTFTGYGVFPVMAGSVEDTDYAFEVTDGTQLFRLTVETDDPAEFYVAPPSCPYDNVADCRSDEHYTDDYMGYEVEGPEAGTWRFQLAGSWWLGRSPVNEVQWTMRIDRLAPANVTE